VRLASCRVQLSCFATVHFDIDVGPAIAVRHFGATGRLRMACQTALRCALQEMYPPSTLGPRDAKQLCFHALPDSMGAGTCAVRPIVQPPRAARSCNGRYRTISSGRAESWNADALPRR
jgi:hypothetical protein